jgi:hypothetical protein
MVDTTKMKLSKLVLAVLAAGLATSAFTSQRVQGAMINGAITFAGGAVYDTTSLATATRVDAFSDVAVMSRDGDFAGFVNVGDSVTMTSPWVFMPSTPTPSLWNVGGFTYDLASSTVVLQNADFLVITGTGTISGNGFDPTPGTWSFTSQEPDANGVFSFSASGGSTGVPDGGTTVALLGMGLVGVEVLRRKLVAA